VALFYAFQIAGLNKAKTYDKLNLASKLSASRLWNVLKLTISFFLSKNRQRPTWVALPSSIAIEPTTSCNLRCPECPSGLRSFTRPTGMLEVSLFEKVIEEVKSHVFYLTLYFQGEPYLHPQFLELVRTASKRKMYVTTSTNAHYLTEENARKTVESGLDRLIISIDGTTQETYKQYRVGGQIEKVLEGTRNIVAWKKKLKSTKPFVVFQFLVVRPNEHQVEDAKRLAKKMGVDDIVFKTAQIYEYEKGSDLIPKNEQFSRYKHQIDGTYSIKNQLLNQCWKMWQSCVVTWDGKVVPCCFDKDASHPMGNLQKNSFREVWHSEAYQTFRQSLLVSRDQIDICQNCTEGTTVFAD
jgi:radical SAM protein with 4Fe4S-binding SPASM domain